MESETALKKKKKHDSVCCVRDGLQEDKSVGTGTDGKVAAVLRNNVKVSQTRVVGIKRDGEK